MAGDIAAKERAIVTLTATGASLTSGSAGVANGTADLDCRSAGNVPDDLECRFELTAQWATVTGIANNTVVAELYLVPILDGTNAPDIDLTAGASALPSGSYVGVFVATKAPAQTVNARFITGPVSLFPALLRPYILNRSGQTISANWSLKVVSARAQYT